MSTKSKLLAIADDLRLQDDASRAQHSALTANGTTSAARPSVSPAQMPRTGPGQMLAFRGQILAVESELGHLRDQLKAYDGASPTKKLDPDSVVPSQWANRHKDSYTRPEFLSLKEDIAAAGGNIQPISVRTLRNQAGKFEVIYGHRRHRACLELGLPVLATIETSVSDHELFVAMDRENRERADLSAYEQGMMYRNALSAGLYPSNRRLAESLGVSHTWVANVRQVADLPPAVVAAFRSPLEIQPRHAKAIAASLEQDRKAVLSRAEKLAASPKTLPPAQVVDVLVGLSSTSDAANIIEVAGVKVGRWTSRAGKMSVHLEAANMSEERREMILRAIATALESP